MQLHLGVIIGGGLNQWIEAVLRPDGGNLFDGFEPDVLLGVFQQLLKLGDGARASLGYFTNVFRAQVLGGEPGGAGEKHSGRKNRAHVSNVSRPGRLPRA